MRKLIVFCWIFTITYLVMNVAKGESVLELFPELNTLHSEVYANKASIQSLNTNLNSLTDSLNSRKAHFSARTTQAKNYDYGEVIKFNIVVRDANPSGAYSTSTGIFTAPYDGVYVLTWSVTNSRGTCFDAALSVNETKFFNSRSDSEMSTESSTQVITFRANMGTQFKIVQGGTSCNRLWGWDDTLATFTAFLLYDV